MGARRSLLIVAAVIFAVVAAGGFFIVLTSAEEDEGGKPVRVLVARQDIERGTSGDDVLSDSLLRVVEYPGDKVPENALGSSQQNTLKDKVATADIAQGQFIIRDKSFRPQGDEGTVAFDLDNKKYEGKQAITVEVDLEHGVAGALQAGDRVNVLEVSDLAPNPAVVPPGTTASIEGNTLDAFYIVQGVEVLNVGRAEKVQETTDAAGNQTSQTENIGLITVAVSMDDAARVARASEGTVYLTLVPSSFAPVENPPTALSILRTPAMIHADRQR